MENRIKIHPSDKSAGLSFYGIVRCENCGTSDLCKVGSINFEIKVPNLYFKKCECCGRSDSEEYYKKDFVFCSIKCFEEWFKDTDWIRLQNCEPFDCYNIKTKRIKRDCYTPGYALELKRQKKKIRKSQIINLGLGANF